MRQFLTALAVISLAASPTLAAPCRDAHGKFIKCAPVKAPSAAGIAKDASVKAPSAAGIAKDASGKCHIASGPKKGQFVKCP